MFRGKKFHIFVSDESIISRRASNQREFHHSPTTSSAAFSHSFSTVAMAFAIAYEILPHWNLWKCYEPDVCFAVDFGFRQATRQLFLAGQEKRMATWTIHFILFMNALPPTNVKNTCRRRPVHIKKKTVYNVDIKTVTLTQTRITQQSQLPHPPTDRRYTAWTFVWTHRVTLDSSYLLVPFLYCVKQCAPECGLAIAMENDMVSEWAADSPWLSPIGSLCDCGMFVVVAVAPATTRRIGGGVRRVMLLKVFVRVYSPRRKHPALVWRMDSTSAAVLAMCCRFGWRIRHE